MLNIIWCFFIICSIIYGIFSGNLIQINNSIFDSIKISTELIISLFGSMCFWNGIMNIVKNTKLINQIIYLINPIIKFLFKNIDEKSDLYKNISLNIISNLLGLGNSATLCGLKAVEEMHEKNLEKNKLSNNEFLFILINTASIQLIPTTIISIRASLGSKSPSLIIPGVWFSSIISFISIILLGKIYLKFKKI